ncbi:MAG TPA: amino acid ABC transporter ATP-binding protein [Acidimicrobiales bacterium]|nr:amino acid ABC transporter ATP-binding protein [Acidimicrobiales bacterium]
MSSFVEVRNVWKRFSGAPVLRGVNLDIKKGSVSCIIGPSGSGKTTLLRCINQLESIDEGVIRVDGSIVGFHQHRNRLYPLSERAKAHEQAKIGMVFQRFNLFPHMTAIQNVMEGPTRVRRMKESVARELALGLLDRVGLIEKANAYPNHLSGGQQQRVAIARALAMEPSLMLFDEPTSALDPELVGEVLDVMRDLGNDGITMILVTHEIAFAKEVANHIIFMNDGLILEEGDSVSVLENPQCERTRDFLAKVL